MHSTYLNYGFASGLSSSEDDDSIPDGSCCILLESFDPNS